MSEFAFRLFKVSQEMAAAKIGTDSLLLASWVNVDKAINILDIGTGTGVIALIMAQRQPKAYITALEPDLNSYMEAISNFRGSVFSERLKGFNLKVQEFVKLDNNRKFDLIVTNPPFFSNGQQSVDQRKNNWRHAISLTHQEIIDCVVELLSLDGSFALILPSTESKIFIAKAYKHRLYLKSYVKVLPFENKEPNRVLMHFSRTLSSVDSQRFVLYNISAASRTKEFRDMLSPYLLKED